MDSPEILFCTVEGCPNPRADQDDPKASNRHCEMHRAESRRKYNSTRLEQQHGKGYVAGVEGMRKLLVDQFEDQIGEAFVTGWEAGALIRQALGPIASDDDASPVNASKPKQADKEPAGARA